MLNMPNKMNASGCLEAHGKRRGGCSGQSEVQPRGCLWSSRCVQLLTNKRTFEDCDGPFY